MKRALLASWLSFAIADAAMADITLVAPDVILGQNETKSINITVIRDAGSPAIWGLDLDMIIRRLGSSLPPLPTMNNLDIIGAGMVFGGEPSSNLSPPAGWGTSNAYTGITASAGHAMSTGQILATLDISGNGAAPGSYELKFDGNFGTTFLYDLNFDRLDPSNPTTPLTVHFTPGGISVVPEPAMIAQLLGLSGAVGFLYLRRRRSARKRKRGRS